MVIALSALAYGLVESNYRSIVAPALETVEGRVGFAAAMRPTFYAIVSFDLLLLLAVGAASFVLARAALRPLLLAREREERFAADVAHELRTPLAAIAGVAQSAPAEDAAAARASFTTIARRALECSALIGDLLTLARGSDRDALVREPVDLAMLAERVVRENEAIAGPATRAVVFDATYQSAIVDGDERRLLQLMRNLVWNAQRYAKSRVTLSLAVRGDRATLVVEDDGPGVSRDLEPRLFERFAKEADSPGSGLGLAICRWVARAHGGEIAYERGSRFVVAFPLARHGRDDVS